MGGKLLISDQETLSSRGEYMPPAGRRWSWPAFLAGVAVAWIIPLAVAAVWGPRTRMTYEDPMTGRARHTATWLGMTLYDRVEENEVSKWADVNSVAGTYPARYGWSPVTTEQSDWFTGMSIGCGGHGIPGRIQRGEIAEKGLTPEQTLRKYQTELAAAFTEHSSTAGVQKNWLETAK
jgi:hypothetical protein